MILHSQSGIYHQFVKYAGVSEFHTNWPKPAKDKKKERKKPLSLSPHLDLITTCLLNLKVLKISDATLQ